MKIVDSSKAPSKAEEIALMGDVVVGLMVSNLQAHALHLSVTGEGSYARHKALNEYYDAVPDVTDKIAEDAQGHYEQLLDLKNPSPVEIPESVEAFVNDLNNLYIIISKAHSMTMCTAIQTVLDDAKSLINSTKYKLLFLK